jgi:Pvc16 N-terminal domain
VSNYKAVATVTAILQRILQSSVQVDIDGVRVTTVQPRNIGNGTPETGINLFLYYVTRNPAFKNADTTTFRSKGTPVKRQAVFDLYYIISFYGNDTELEPQRLLGSVVRTLNDRSNLTPELIQEATRDPSFRFLADSNLAEQIQQLQISPVDLSLDDLSKVWSVFFQAPYMLSLVYKVVVVAIDGEESLQKALPVSDRRFAGIVPFGNRPVVEQVISAAGKLEPILADSTLQIRGKQLASEFTQVRINGLEISPSEVSDSQIVLFLRDLPVDCLRAGVTSLQVTHRISIDTTSNNRLRAVESNAAPFVLRPTIKLVRLSNQTGRDDEMRSLILRVQVDVMVGMKQRVLLAMNEWTVDNPVGYQFEANSRKASTDTIAFALQGVKPGEYLLRLQIDGADSLLSIDTEETSPTFNWYNAPKVRIE